jgi:hypothetical protein
VSTIEDNYRASLAWGVEGWNAHTASSRLLAGLDWTLAGRKPDGAPYTILQSVNHILFWNGFALAACRGETPPRPEHAADGGPGPAAPSSADDWEGVVRAYKGSLAAITAEIARVDLTALTPSGRRTCADVLRSMGNHISYHGGQIALLRRLLGAWPPPGGGDTW